MRKVTVVTPKKRALFHTDPLKVDGVLTRAKNTLEGNKKWEKNGLVFELSRYNLDVLRDYYGELEIIDPFEETELPTDQVEEFKFKTEPFKFQRLALERIKHAPNNGRNFALICDPGTGKSKVSIDRATQLYCEGKIESVIVVAPKGVHEQWLDEIKKHCSVDTDVQYWKGPRTEVDVTEHFAWWCINYDALRTHSGWDATEDFILYHGTPLVIFDESHFVKNKSSVRWKKSYALANNENVHSKILLTGTPIANNLLDFWAQFYILDYNIIGMKYANKFKQKYCILGGRYNSEVMENINVDEFMGLIEPYIYRARKSDLDDIPDKVYNDYYFRLPPKLRKHYTQVTQELLLEIKKKKILDVKNLMTRAIKLQQISNGFVKDSMGEIVELVESSKNVRIKALKEVIENSHSHKIIIWCRFRYDVDIIMFELNKSYEQAVSYTGGMSSQFRRKALDLWNKNPQIRFFVATPAAAGTGLNLQNSGCTHAIYYSQDHKLVDRLQSEDRIHRIGARADRIIYTDIICRNSRDKHIQRNLRRKKTLSQMTLGDIQREFEEYV